MTKVVATPYQKLPIDPFDRRHRILRRSFAQAGTKARVRTATPAPGRARRRDRRADPDPADRRCGGSAVSESAGCGARRAGGLAGPTRHPRRCRGRAGRAGRLCRPYPHRRPGQSRRDGGAGRGRLRRRHALVQVGPGRRPQPHPSGPPRGPRQLEGRQAVPGVAGSLGERVHGRSAASGFPRAPGHRRGRAWTAVDRIRNRRPIGRRAGRRRQADASDRPPAERRAQERRCRGVGSGRRPGPDHHGRPRGRAAERDRRPVPNPGRAGAGGRPDPDRRPALSGPEDAARRRARGA